MTRPIIVPLDGSALADTALPHAAALARTYGTGLHLVRVHVPVIAYAAAESPIAIPDPAWDERVRNLAAEWVLAKAADVRSRYPFHVTYELRVGVPADEIAAAAKARDARAIVCTTHGHGGWAPQWVGSVTDGIIRHAACPVLAMSEDGVLREPGIKRILVPIDGSEMAVAILPHVRELALAAGAVVELYRVVSPPWVGDAINALQSGHVDRFGVDPAASHAKHELERAAQDLVVHGIHATSCVEVATNPTRAILDRIALTNPDVVALTTHGRGVSRLFMGSVADKVMRAAGRPALCWRPPGTHVPSRTHAPSDAERMFATAASGATM